MSTSPPLDEILELACRAPSVHNTQPWRWRITGTRIDLFADYSRQLLQADPAGRDLMISCGAALHHFQVAAACLGWTARVRRLPDILNERHIARIELTRSDPAPEATVLLEALQGRRTDRRRPTSWPVPWDRLVNLASTGNSWGAHVLPVEAEATKAHLERSPTRSGGSSTVARRTWPS